MLNKASGRILWKYWNWQIALQGITGLAHSRLHNRAENNLSVLRTVSKVLFDDSQSLLSLTMHYSESAPWLGWHVAVEDAGGWWGRQQGRRQGDSLWRLQRPRELQP